MIRCLTKTTTCVVAKPPVDIKVDRSFAVFLAAESMRIFFLSLKAPTQHGNFFLILSLGTYTVTLVNI